MKAPLLRNLVLGLIASSLLAAPARGLTGTWNLNPANGDWNAPSNWSSMSAPNGPADIAAFGFSNVTSVFLSANTEVDSIFFNAGASAYTITSRPSRTLTISGGGIGNMSGLTQNFVAEADGQGNFGTIAFAGSASAGTAANYVAQGSMMRSRNFDLPGGTISFRDISNAAYGTFTLNGGSVSGANGGLTVFSNNSSAANAVFTAQGSGVLDAIGSHIEFHDNASAGQAVFVNKGGAQDAYPTISPAGDIILHSSRGAEMTFRNNSTAGAASITNNGGTAVYADGSGVGFRDNSTAGSATITNNGGMAYRAVGGSTGFGDNSSAGNAIIVNNGSATAAAYGARTSFLDSSSAGNALLVANGGSQGGEGGQIYFYLGSEGGTARVQVFGNGSLDIAPRDRPGVTIGSLAGSGVVFLGGNNLIVGGNGESTTYSGLMRDGGHGGGPGADDTGGSLTKTGAGTLTIAGSNTYTGATIIAAGTLILNGSITSAVTVNGGMLGGSGTARALTVNSGGALSPGTGNSPGILSVFGNLKLSLGSTYLVDLNGTAVGIQYDQTNVTGTIILENATLLLRIGGPLLVGSQFMILNNGGTNAVLGQFSGLSEGGTFTAGSQTFIISYQGNDGNDVVLTAVVPEPETWVLLSGGIGLIVWKFGARKAAAKTGR